MAYYPQQSSFFGPIEKVLTPAGVYPTDAGAPPGETAAQEPVSPRWFSSESGCRQPVQSSSRRLSGPPARSREGGILLVDDQKELLNLLSRALEIEGYAVWQAEGGTEALRVAETEGDRIRLLLTDIRMPGMDGYELARELTRRRPNVRVLYMSGYSENLPPAGVPFLQKPFRLDTLKREVERLLRDDWPAAM